MRVSATPAAPTLAAFPRSLPGVLYFHADEEARRLIQGIHRYRRSAFEQLEQNLREGEWIVVCSTERMLADNYHRVRLPNVRVIAFSTRRFRDPRTDGAVYLYLP